MATSQNTALGLFNTAAQEGALSAASVRALTLRDVGQEINAAIGVDLSRTIDTSEAVLVNFLIDDSGSIATAKREKDVIAGVNSVLDALQGASGRQRDAVLVSVRYLNGTLLCPVVPLNQVPRMDHNNYQANGGTPLWDQTAIILGTAIATAQNFADNGIPTRTISLIVSDGLDQHSRTQNEASVASIVQDMLAQEAHVIAVIGIGDEVEFKRIFTGIGVPDEWIYTVNGAAQNAGQDLRRAFGMFSSSAVRASQSAKNFSQTAAAGFTAP